MKELIITGLLIFSHAIYVHAQNCASNLSCASAQQLCEADTVSFNCNSCSMGSNPEIWFEFTLNATGTAILNVYENDGIGAYSDIFSGYELYGPLSNSQDCSSLPLASSSSTLDTGFYSMDNLTSGHYLLKVDMLGCADSVQHVRAFVEGGTVLGCDTIAAQPCENCIGSFAPIPGEKYVLSAWVKEDNASLSKTSYTFPEIYLDFPSASTTLGPYTASGEIIDGWQRIEQEFTMPATATEFKLQLKSTSGYCYFDDIRVFPFNASMKSYVYDPVFMRLSAELDERHYATYYEYDEEGKLIRIKKETEKGIMTIQETRNNSSK